MPPPSSRATSPPVHDSQRASTPPSYFHSALRELESPVSQEVLTLAETLTTQAADEEATDARLRYLQARAQAHDEHLEARAERYRERLQSSDYRDRHDRLRRVMNRLSRIHDPPAYGDRIPSQSQNNLYDWSPANEADDEQELDNILAELRREQPHTHPEILRVLGRSQLDTERESRLRSHSSRLLLDSSPRQAALLQSARRHPRFSARAQRHPSSDREPASRPAAATTTTTTTTTSTTSTTTTHHADAGSSLRYRSAADDARQAAMQRLSERRSSLERERDRDTLARVDSYRRSYLDRTAAAGGHATSTVSTMLENTIKYLSRIRYANTVDDSIDCALYAGFLNKDYACDSSHADFVLDTYSLPPPAETSWLVPGAVLSGCQHATSVTSTITSATTGSSTTLFRSSNTLFDPTRPWLSTGSYAPPRRLHTPETVTSHTPQQDRWPVKVTIHAVDYSKMSLSATMEAYNVPSHPNAHSLNNADTGSYTRTSSITTYLEGEILDFNTHSLLTESFTSTAYNDATYWRKLPPFQKFTDEELVRKLTSKRWLVEELSREWVLMRWKERCFVKSLNRSTSDPVLPPTQSFTSTISSSFDPYSLARHPPYTSYEALPSPSASPSPGPDFTERERPAIRPPRLSDSQPRSQTSAPRLTLAGLAAAARGEEEAESTQSVPSASSYPIRNDPWPWPTSREHEPPYRDHTRAFADSRRDNSNGDAVREVGYDESGCGLTISGFYYVCLRRGDGRLEGLYHDPQSSPYQCLKLESVNGGVFPAWGFR